MGNNRVQQIGTPLEIYRNPANTFVAQFIGASNLLPGVLTKPASVVTHGVPIQVDPPDNLDDGAEVMISVRPENITLLPGNHEGLNRINA